MQIIHTYKISGPTPSQKKTVFCIKISVDAGEGFFLKESQAVRGGKVITEAIIALGIS